MNLLTEFQQIIIGGVIGFGMAIVLILSVIILGHPRNTENEE